MPSMEDEWNRYPMRQRLHDIAYNGTFNEMSVIAKALLEILPNSARTTTIYSVSSQIEAVLRATESISKKQDDIIARLDALEGQNQNRSVNPAVSQQLLRLEDQFRK
jgi:hypothetical protein